MAMWLCIIQELYCVPACEDTRRAEETASSPVLELTYDCSGYISWPDLSYVSPLSCQWGWGTNMLLFFSECPKPQLKYVPSPPSNEEENRCLERNQCLTHLHKVFCTPVFPSDMWPSLILHSIFRNIL